MRSKTGITALLPKVIAGDRDAADRLSRLVYEDLRQMASQLFKRERSNHTLQPTVIANDALMRLLGTKNVAWEDRAHFYRFAARNMRQVLVDYARQKNAERRRPPGERVCMDDVASLLEPGQAVDVERLDEALQALERLSELAERQAQGVVLRVFGSLSDDQVAFLLGVSETTAKNDWRAARAWLRVELAEA